MDRLGTSLLVTSLALVVGLSEAAAQDRAVVERLVEFGRMSRREAVDAVRTVDRVLAQNAETGGTRYDPIRQVVGRVMFQHPGRTRDVYAQRLEAVIARMRGGLDEELLTALFRAEANAAVMCADRFGATIQECDALLAASAGERAALPYTAPDDGRELQQALRASRVRARVAREVATKLREAMVGVPRTLSRDERGQAMLRLLEACPGALTRRESQVRAWHVGPTEGMARCLAQKIAHRSSAEQAQERAQLVFGMSPAAAAAFVSWGAPQAAPAPVVTSPAPAPRAAPPPSDSSAQRSLQEAREHFSARRYAQAAAAYEEATRIRSEDAGAWAGLGAAKMALGEAGAAAEAYQHAVRLEPGNAGYWTWLARAQARANDRAGAVQSLRRALAIDPNNRTARQGLSAMMGGASPSGPAPAPAPAPSAPPAPAPPGPPPAQLPEVPDRQAIIAVMRPLQAQVASCHPSYDGRVSFNLTVTGESGTVSEAALEGELAGTPEAECMLNVIRAARFPRFSRDTLEIAYPYAL